MSDEPYDDELLSAILDGLADDATVASVRNDPEASARLDQLSAVARLVGTPPSQATPERRAESIAAALAAAEPAPEVRSLSVARERRAAVQRRSPRIQWLAVAAAALVVAIAIPLLASLRGGGSTDTAADAIDSADSTSLSAEGSADDAMSDDDTADRATTASGDAGAEGVEPAAPAADSDLGDPAPTSTTIAPPELTDEAEAAESAEDDAEAALTRMRFASPVELGGLIDAGLIEPMLTIDDPILVDAVSPDCLLPIESGDAVVFALAELVPLGEPTQVVLIHFLDDGAFTALDAGDCSPIG